jgi:O-methyltransferase involved in polyketide biosynthesis
MAPSLNIRPGPDAISPTAHYTGQTWVRNGLSHPGLATWQGRLLFDALRPPMALNRALGRPTLEGLLLARHRIIDHALEQLIEAGAVGQVVEAACGMSPRGWRFSSRYGDRLTYVEADLPAMAERKRDALARMGSLTDHHSVAELDLLRDRGAMSLDSLIEGLDPDRGTAIVTEGLLTYLDGEEVAALWRRIATALGRFPQGCYLADMRLAGPDRGLAERAFYVVLSGFVRGWVHSHFSDEAEAEAALEAAGFDRAKLHRGDAHPSAEAMRDDPGAGLIRVIEASVGP